MGEVRERGEVKERGSEGKRWKVKEREGAVGKNERKRKKRANGSSWKLL